MKFEHILVFYKTTPEIETKASQIAQELQADLEPDRGQNEPVNSNYDLVIPIGGDGTILHSERKYPHIIKLPLQAGHRGFLASLPIENWMEAWQKIKQNEYDIDERGKVRVGEYEALNEIYLTAAEPGQMFECQITLEKYTWKLRGDGLIIGTPTGSTAYSLSAGGSLLTPHLPVLSLVAVSPFHLDWRNLVISNTSEIKVKLMTNGVLVVDGVKEKTLAATQELVIRKADRPARLISFKTTSFFQKIELLKE